MLLNLFDMLQIQVPHIQDEQCNLNDDSQATYTLHL